MTLFGVHQWSDVAARLREMRRVTRGPVVVLTCDPKLVRDFWLSEYAPEVLDPAARQACPAWRFVGDGVRERLDRTLRRDLRSGACDERFGHLREQPTYAGLLVIVRATP